MRWSVQSERPEGLAGLQATGGSARTSLVLSNCCPICKLAGTTWCTTFEGLQEQSRVKHNERTKEVHRGGQPRGERLAIWRRTPRRSRWCGPFSTRRSTIAVREGVGELILLEGEAGTLRTLICYCGRPAGGVHRSWTEIGKLCTRASRERNEKTCTTSFVEMRDEGSQCS